MPTSSNSDDDTPAWIKGDLPADKPESTAEPSSTESNNIETPEPEERTTATVHAASAEWLEKFDGPDLNAEANDIEIETIELEVEPALVITAEEEATPDAADEGSVDT